MRTSRRHPNNLGTVRIATVDAARLADRIVKQLRALNRVRLCTAPSRATSRSVSSRSTWTIARIRRKPLCLGLPDHDRQPVRRVRAAVVPLLAHHRRRRAQVEEVRGAGVVGEQPELNPGDSYQYTSGCPLSTPSGSWSGTTRCATKRGETFDIAIPAFSLDIPDAHATGELRRSTRAPSLDRLETPPGRTRRPSSRTRS